jgi:hypothetical protein
MRNYNEKDIRFYDPANQIEGDYVVDETGDFALTEDYESARQDMNNRIQTQKSDWRSHPNIGADLELLEGEPNTRETGMKGSSQIYESLSYDDRFALEDINVRAVPTSIEKIEFFIMLDTDETNPVVINKPLEL